MIFHVLSLLHHCLKKHTKESFLSALTWSAGRAWAQSNTAFPSIFNFPLWYFDNLTILTVCFSFTFSAPSKWRRSVAYLTNARPFHYFSESLCKYHWHCCRLLPTNEGRFTHRETGFDGDISRLSLKDYTFLKVLDTSVSGSALVSYRVLESKLFWHLKS